MCWAREVAQLEALDPGAGTWGDAASAGLGLVVDFDPVVLEPGELSAFVGTKAIGGTHPEGPAPVRLADLLVRELDGLVGGDVALGELVDAVAAAGFEEDAGFKAQGLGHLGQQVALVAAAGAAGGHGADDPEQGPLGDGPRGRELAQGGGPFLGPGAGTALGVLAVLAGVEGLGCLEEVGDRDALLSSVCGFPVLPGEDPCAQLLAQDHRATLGFKEVGTWERDALLFAPSTVASGKGRYQRVDTPAQLDGAPELPRL